MAVTEAAKELVDAFLARDVRATFDPANIQPPCILIAPNGFAFDRLNGECVTYEFTIYAVAPGVRIADSLPVLDVLANHVHEVVGFKEAQPGSVPFGEGSLPAYVLTVSLDGEWSEK